VKDVDLIIIGGGVSGLLVAAECARMYGPTKKILLIEKSRGLGGRICQKRGTFFNDDSLSLPQGLVEWPKELQRIFQRRAGERLSQVWARFLPSSVETLLQKRVLQVSHDQKWTVTTDDQDITLSAKQLIVALPAPQAKELLLPVIPLFPTVSYAGHLILYTHEPLDEKAQAFFAGIKSVVEDLSQWEKKIGCYRISLREAGPFWNEPLGAVTHSLEEQLKIKLDAHRWKFSYPLSYLKEDFFYDDSLKLGVTGDYFAEHKEGAVIGALLSATKLARRVVGLSSL
jgi:predicted NAD/FAD-dependent oxidoreductase